MKRLKFIRISKILLFLGDFSILNGLFLVFFLTGHLLVLHNINGWQVVLIIIDLSWILIMILFNSYEVSRVYRFDRSISLVVNSVFQHFLVATTTIYFLDFKMVHKWSLPMAYFILFWLILLWRISFYYLLSIYRTRGNNILKVLIIGYGPASKEIENFILAHPETGYQLIGYFDDHDHGVRLKENFLGYISSLESFLAANKVDEIYCCLPSLKRGALKKIIDISDSYLIKVRLLADYQPFFFKGLELKRYDHIPVINVMPTPLDLQRNQILKRTFDLVISMVVVLFVFTWLFPLIAIAIKLDSRGRIFFKQKRSGLQNQVFWCYKFRTMIENPEADTRQALQNDDRITRVGRFLRKTSLDELPQIFNVIEGSMSLVGPRPHMSKHTEEYSYQLGKFMSRHFVKPGITGLAQSKGYRGETRHLRDMKNRLTMDRFYISNWSFLLDIKIIIQTIMTLWRRNQNAY